MNWKDFWNKKAQSENPNLQVGRIKANNEIGDQHLELITASIIDLLRIKASDELLDVCCGNGLLTEMLAPYCKSIVGIDFSDSLIHNAYHNKKANNTSYFLADARNFSLERKFDKIYLYFSFQYFESNKIGENVIRQMLEHLKPGGKILIGDIPNEEKWAVYYDTFEKKMRYIKHKIFGRNDMGKFWSKTELDRISHKLNCKGRKISQSSLLPYFLYRFDYLIERKSV